MKSWLRKVWGYTRFITEFFIFHRDKPYVLGLVTNDTCNLHCAHCRVANVYNYNMTFDQITEILEQHYKRGFRLLYLEGGEPYLWHDGDHNLSDVIKQANEIGYLRVHVYTNGATHTDGQPDFTWFSIDGLDESFRKIRGIPLERVMRNIRGFKGRHAIVFVVNTINYQEIREFLEYIHQELPGTRVMFYFHTPYYGIDELFLSPVQKKEAVDSILNCKKEGLPVLNSKVALNSYLEGNKGLPANYCYVVDQTGEYRCCRVNGNPEICKNCGYTMYNEIIQARAWKPGAIIGLLKGY